ncbi:hypothetical protein EG829_14735, partial [bacterium]|nr:hypothetical protein [bacterium]
MSFEFAADTRTSYREPPESLVDELLSELKRDDIVLSDSVEPLARELSRDVIVSPVPDESSLSELRRDVSRSCDSPERFTVSVVLEPDVSDRSSTRSLREELSVDAVLD